MLVYFIPLKAHWSNHAGNVMFLPLPGTNRTAIYEATQYSEDRPPSQHKIGHMDFPVNEESITQWAYAHFKDCPKHPAIIKMDTENFTQELCMDKYIEDFVSDNYEEIIRRLNARD